MASVGSIETKYTAAFLSEFGAALDKWGTLQANAVFQAAMEILWKYKIPSLKVVKPWEVLCHMDNRDKLMLSAFNAHRNGAVIHSIGADGRQLVNAFAMELPAVGPNRQKNIEANIQLVARSQGLLAPVNGSEFILSLGTGHTAAFFKAVEAGGPTPEKTLQDSDGNFDKHKLKANAEFTRLCEHGWEWTIIPAEIDNLFPKFAHIAQKALNTSNHVASTTGELEGARTMADMVTDPTLQGREDLDKIILQHIADLALPCASYSEHILKFVKLFGGGPGGPTILFMDKVGKDFGCTLKLGEAFWQALANTTFFDKTKIYPLLRVSLAMTNMASPSAKVDEGIARLLTKMDVVKLAGRQQQARADLAEDALLGCEDIRRTIEHLPRYDEATANKSFGQFFVRIGLWATEKGKLGHEKKDYTMAQLKELLLASFAKMFGAAVKYPKWEVNDTPEPKATTKAAPPPKAAEPAAPAHASLATHADVTNPVFIAARAGYKIQSMVYEKNDGAKSGPAIENCFIISSISFDGTVLLTKAQAYNPASHYTGKVSLAELLQKWSLSTVARPIKLNSKQCRPDSMTVDSHKCLIYQALLAADGHANTVNQSLEFWKRADMLRTSTDVKEGALVLTPMTTLSSITTKGGSGSVGFGKFQVGDKKVELFANAPPKPLQDLDDPAEVGPDSALVAFWWVAPTNVKAQANMALSTISKNGIEIPVLKNCKAIPAWERLWKYVAPSTPSPTSLVAEKAKPAAKRARKSV